MTAIKHSHSLYLGGLFSGKTSLRDSVHTVRKLVASGRADGKFNRFTHVAVRGVSGCAIGGAVAVNLRKGLIVVRKPNVASHSNIDAEGVPINIGFNYIIVDDFVATGETLAATVDSIQKSNPSAKCVGVVMYDHCFVKSWVEMIADRCFLTEKYG